MAIGHVRVLAALAAAIALHALLLSWPMPVVHHLAFSDAPLSVELLKTEQPHPEPSNLAAPVAQTRSAGGLPSRQPQAMQEPKRQAETHRVAHIKAGTKRAAIARARDKVVYENMGHENLAHEKQHYAPELPMQPANRDALAVSDHALDHQPITQSMKAHKESAAEHPVHTAPLPADVQAMLMAHIGYPVRARRHGWQGSGQFELDIDRQRIRSVTMLASTGHAILDRAAERGLSTVAHLPVADGSYRLPVTFRLR